MPVPSVHIRTATFSDGQTITFNEDDIVVLVGPNNAGKSVALRNIRDKAHDTRNPGVVVNSVTTQKIGTLEDVLRLLDSKCRLNCDNLQSPFYQALGFSIQKYAVGNCWSVVDTLGELTWFFVYLLTAEERLKTAKPADSISLVDDAPSHPIHYMQKDDRIELKISELFREAFGVDLVVHRNAGGTVPLYCGERPTPVPPDDRASYRYTLALEHLDKLEHQGDGMRAFVGVLLHSLVVDHSVVLIDEPEAFLHPPQARLLGRMLVKEAPRARQLFISTHSGDILRGLLDAASDRVRVIRLQRSGDVNSVAELDNAGVKQLWGDSLLRYSNVLDGVFHSKVVICESDADCRFYGAICDVLFDAAAGTMRPDTMFIHCGGKDRIASVIRALSDLRVRICAVADFDILSEERPFRDIFEGLGGAWPEVASDWKRVKTAIDAKKPELNAETVKTEIADVVASFAPTTGPLPKDVKERIVRILRKASPWAIAKETGKRYVPSGDPAQAYLRIADKCRGSGLFVVEVGELERFVPSLGGHGPGWVSKVLECKNLLNDDEMEEARSFVKTLFADELNQATQSAEASRRRASS